MKYSILIAVFLLHLMTIVDANAESGLLGFFADSVNIERHVPSSGKMESTYFSLNSKDLDLNQQNELEFVRGRQGEEKGCRAQIQFLMCLVDPIDNQGERECLPGGERYAPSFEKIYDLYPPALQKVFCSLDVIFIEKQFFGTAYAFSSAENGIAVMGIRQSVLDEKLNLTTWASWKDQLSFGGKVDSYAITPGLPIVRTSSPSIVNDFLYFVVAHEFAHILDLTNNVNSLKDDCPDETEEEPFPECEMEEESWGRISWITNRQPKPQNDFPNRSGLCFYICDNGVIPSEEVPQVYQNLYLQTDFISLYGATNPWDDFAESLAYFLMDKYLSTTYEFDTAQGDTYDVIEKLHSPIFQRKLEYLENFINRTDLKYPKDFQK